jgi:hypothetical protein
MPISHDVDTWDGETLLTNTGEKIGQIDGIYLDGDTDEPAWLAVKTGMLGSAVSLVPVQGATPANDGVAVPYDKKLIKGAPTFKPDDEISDEDSRALYAHYSIGSPQPGSAVEPDMSAPPTPIDSAPMDSAEAATIARVPVNQANLG